MAYFPTLRGLPRIFDLDSMQWLDLPFQLDEYPEVLQVELDVLQSEGRQVETMPGVPWTRWRLRMEAMDERTAKRWKLFFDRTLARGRRVEVIRDSGRYFWLPGDSERDVCAGQAPIAGSVYTLATKGGRRGNGSIGVDAADPGTATRTNLLPNGDVLDGPEGGTPTGWTNSTPSTLSVTVSSYTRPDGETGRCIKFSSLGAGSKVAYVDFDFAGYNASSILSDAIAQQMLIRAEVHPQQVLTNLVDTAVLVGATAYQGWKNTPTHEWARVLQGIIENDASTTTAGKLRFTFSDDLAVAPVYVTELQLEIRSGVWTSFIPYSVDRELSGSRASADLLSYVNGLHYRHQLPAWKAGERWGYTRAFDFEPGWGSSKIPSATVTLFADGDVASTGNTGALNIAATSSTIVASAVPSDNSTALTATKSSYSWVAGQIPNIIVSWRDWDGVNAGSGNLDLYVEGVLAQATTHSKLGARQGERVWYGTRKDGSIPICGRFSEVGAEPVYIDGSTITIGDFFRTVDDPPVRPDRNSARCVLDQRQAGRSDATRENTVPLDVALLEAVQ